MTDAAEQNILQLLKLKFGIVGTSPAMKDAIARLVRVAPTDLTVLITGETGTGKEVFANAVHGLSHRRKFPFVSVNCGAIPETLLESELFGNEKGAFTGAVEQRKGFFEVADRGTIFLDEIGEMPIATQVKLLRVLENGEFSRLGSSSLQKVDVRVIAATNRDLEYEVRQGRFRQDLFFRLNSVHIILPPLRMHPDDIPEMAEFFARKCSEKTGFRFEGISEEALEILKRLPWPGNNRELRNMIETLVTLERGKFITGELLRRYTTRALPPPDRERELQSAIVHVPPAEEKKISDTELILRSLLELKHDVSDIKRFLANFFSNFTPAPDEEADVHEDVAPDEEFVQPGQNGYGKIVLDDDIRLEDAERKIIAASLNKHAGNRRETAKSLGISERTLYRKIIEYGLE